MSPIDCNHVPPLKDWFNPPAIVDDREEIDYDYPKLRFVQDVDSEELKEWLDDFEAKQFPDSVVAVQVATLEQRFTAEARKWESETEHISSPTRRMLHPSYQAILGMGREVIPLLLRDLRDNRRAWFGALSYLTTENPIRREDAGNMDRMILAWVNWGKSRGLL